MAVTVGVELVEAFCCTCGLMFGMTRNYQNLLLEKGNTQGFYCPAGHGQHYSRKSKDQQIADLKWEMQQKDNRLAEARAEKERLEKRIKKGVCLYCKRTFPNLANHMACKHSKKK